MQGYPTTPDPQQSPQPQQPQPMPHMPQQNPPAYGPPAFAPVPAPGAPNAPRSNRNKLLIGGGIGCGVLLILCMCVGLMSAIASQGNSRASSTSSASSPTATPAQQHTKAPQPTPTPNVNASAPAYAKIVSSDSTTLSDDLNQVGSNCGSSQDLAKCRSALVSVQQDSETFLSDLDGQPAPPCMSSVDKPLRAALHDIDAAAQEIIDGIDNYDVTEVNNGTKLMSKATTEIDTASSELDNVSCS